MRRRIASQMIGVFAVFAGALTASADDVHVSGLLHQSLGDAQFGPVEGRKLSMSNIGSTGLDGVEVRFESVYGGDVAVDVGALMGSAAGAEVRLRHKGWDGTVKGNHALVSDGDGTATMMFDFSGLGATEVHILEYDANGVLLSETTTGGPFVNKEWVPNYTCPDGSTPIFQSGWRQVCPTCPPFLWVGWACPGGGTFTYEPHQRMIVTPTLPPGVPTPAGIESTMVTAGGIPELTVSEATVATFGADCWGLGQAQLAEVCDDPNGCTPEQLVLAVDNLGSSGLDGVSIHVGPHAAGGEARVGRCKDCPVRGVTIMKFYDEEGGETFRATQTENPATGGVGLSVDSAGVGATETIVTFYDVGGGVLRTINLDSGAEIDMPLCSPGTTPLFAWNGNKYVFVGCAIATDYGLPSGEVVTGVSWLGFEALNPLDARRAAGLDVLSDDPDGIYIESVTATPFEAGDLNCDGLTNFGDIDPFVLTLTDPGAYLSAYPDCDRGGADINGDGLVNFGDIDSFVELLTGG